MDGICHIHGRYEGEKCPWCVLGELPKGNKVSRKGKAVARVSALKGSGSKGSGRKSRHGAGNGPKVNLVTPTK